MINILSGLITSETLSKVGSICPGNRNWLIFIRGNRVVYTGRYGRARNAGLLRAYLCDMAREPHIWLEYTYKKDFDNACEVLAEHMR